MKELLTVITPTYNRGNLLENCYNSLKNQVDLNFEWLIIDDGSTDNTKDVVDKFISENIVPIRYIYKKNGGKHTALNIGFKEAKGELSLILDSDDTLTKDAVRSIWEVWDKSKNINDISSIVFLRRYKNGEIIGDNFKEDMKVTNHIDIAFNNRVRGDKCEVYVTDILKQYQYPIFENEKFMSESVVWTQIGRKYRLICVNKPIYITEYLPGGLTKSGRKLRINCPLGGMLFAKECIKDDIILKYRIKNAILYVCYGFFAKKKLSYMVNESGSKVLVFFMIPLGYTLYKYWNYKYKV